jgi:hypothetical protein
MKEQRFLHNQQRPAAQPPPHPDQSGIEIDWRENTGMVIKIQNCHIEMATNNSKDLLKSDCRQTHDTPRMSGVDNRKIFTSKSGRHAT